MKRHLNSILVVEGKEDASYLSNYIASEIVVVNGFELNDNLISYLKNKKVIVLTDPDEAGKTIRKQLNDKLNNVDNVEIDIAKCSRGHKNGVAECEIDEIMDKLSPFFVEKFPSESLITSSDLYSLGISNNKQLREYVCKKMNLGNCNNKRLLKRIRSNNVELDLLKTIVKKYKNGN